MRTRVDAWTYDGSVTTWEASVTAPDDDNPGWRDVVTVEWITLTRSEVDAIAAAWGILTDRDLDRVMYS